MTRGGPLSWYRLGREDEHPCVDLARNIAGEARVDHHDSWLGVDNSSFDCVRSSDQVRLHRRCVTVEAQFVEPERTQ